MKRKLLAALFILFCYHLQAQVIKNYEQQWNTVEALIQKGLPKSALEEVQKIYMTAKAERQDAQVIKALLYKLGLQRENRENDLPLSIAEMEAELKPAKEPVASLLHSLLADLYLDYFSRNRWKMYNRTNTTNFVKTDIATWTSEDFAKKTSALYLLSIEHADLLKKTKLEPFDALLLKGNTRQLRPTLYDLLAHKALVYFKNNEWQIKKPAYAFEINQQEAFAPADIFIKTKFATNDSLSVHHKALLVYQDLLAFHTNDTRKDAFIDVDIDRIQFVHQYSVAKEKEQLYKNALEDAIKKYAGYSGVSQAKYLLAAHYNEMAGKFSTGDTSFQFERLKAKNLLEEVVKDSVVKTEGWANSYNLLYQITQPSFTYETEKVNLPGQPFRVLVRYKNTKMLHLRLLENNDKLLKKIDYVYSNDYWKVLAKEKAVRSWEQALPDMGDLQEHTVEIKVDPLPVGDYILFASAHEEFTSDTNLLGAAYFSVSRISYVQKDGDFFIMDRETGKPLEGAKMEVFQNVYNNKANRSEKKLIGTYTADDHGLAKVLDQKGERSNSYLVSIDYNADHLSSGNYFYSYRSNVAKEEDLKIFFFMDRSIYRPGQTVYLKGIAVRKKTNGSTVAANHKTLVFLRDPNRNSVDSLAVVTNEFGSFSGKFVLPQNVLNGEFVLYEKEDDNQYSFSVEEYKRPKFYVDFEKVKQTFKVGDSVIANGVAKAYAGNNIEGAKVVYRVVRRPRFIYSWLFRGGWMPRTEEMEIAHGEMLTKADGSFKVPFTAIPDLAVKKEFDPVFDYQVYADITDVNGETRSGSTLISVGYKQILLDVRTDVRIESDSLKSIRVRTTNMNGVYQPAVISVQVSKLIPEQRLIRSRYWQRPDQFLMTKEEYVKLFPHDEYKNESDYANWPVQEIVYQRKDATNENGIFLLPDNKLAAGFYKVEISTDDKQGGNIKDVRYFEIFNPKAESLSRPEYLWTKVNNEPVEPGQKTAVQLGSSASDLFVVTELNKTTTPVDEANYTYTSLNKNKTSFAYTATEKDRGGFGVSYFFIKDNRLHQFNTIVSVPWTNKQLDVSFSTFRDKTMPGSLEKWNVTIKGNKKEAVTAEMLTSMYDASLDQFKGHRWQVPAIWPNYYMRQVWESGDNFAKVTSQSRWLNQWRYQYTNKQYDQFNLSYNDVARFDFKTRNGVREESMSAPGALQGRLPGVQTNDGLSEVVVVGYGTQRKEAVTGAVASMRIRGNSSLNATVPLYVVDGEIVSAIPNIDPNEILSINMLNASEATAIYGERAANGVIIISTKSGPKKLLTNDITPRKNFNETAFFFPDLKTDKDGNITFSFTMPEALTRWKLQTIGHTKDLAFGYNSKEVITQKDLMVQPNTPRFLREGDRIELSAKIVNLSDKELTGQAEFQLLDAATNKPVDGWFLNSFPSQYFTVAAQSSEAIKFPIEIPFGFNKPLTWRLVARSGNFSDGEEAILPVLTNKMLVTETMPLPMKGTGTKTFTFEKLLASSASETLQQHALTIEYTSNPVWYVVQALPYLMEYPYECAEQTWNRYNANALAAKIANSSPRIKQVFEQWKIKDTAALLSNLQKNSQLKSLLLQETPWVLQAKTEEQQKKNIALLFDMVRMSNELKLNFEKLKGMQTDGGGFAWFKGGPDNRYMTQYIVTGIGHLKKLGGIPKDQEALLTNMVQNALSFVDRKIKEDYDNLIKYKADLKSQQVGYTQVQYLYMRSFFPEQPVSASAQTAFSYYRKQAQQYWVKLNKYAQGMTALTLYRTGEEGTPSAILKSLKETSIEQEELGRYWKENSFGYTPFWWSAPIETQSLMIEAFTEVEKDNNTVAQLKTWLLKNKQTTNWRTTKATSDACYALLLQGSNWLTSEPTVTIQLGSTIVSNTTQSTEAGTGYFKKNIEASLIKPDMGNISVTVKAPSADLKGKGLNQSSGKPSWGAVYWQYFEDLDKITTAATPLRVVKKLFIEKNGDRGPVLTPVEEGTPLHTGDKIKVRIELRVDRDLEYVHMKDMRASALEPVNVLSGYKWQGGLGYYESTKDASTNFFFDQLRKGTYVFEYPLFASHEGNFSNGITTVQCMYAPEFSAHSEGSRLRVE